MEAIDSYDEYKGATLETWAYSKINNRINDYITYNTSNISRNSHLEHERVTFNKAETSLRNELRREPTFEELMNKLEWSEKKLVRHLTRATVVMADFTEEFENSLPEQAHINSPHRNWINESNNELIQTMLNDLSHKEREVIELRFGFRGEEYTLREVGEMLGYSSEGVRKIENRALTKLRTHDDMWRIMR